MKRFLPIIFILFFQFKICEVSGSEVKYFAEQMVTDTTEQKSSAKEYKRSERTKMPPTRLGNTSRRSHFRHRIGKSSRLTAAPRKNTSRYHTGRRRHTPVASDKKARMLRRNRGWE